MKTWKRTRTTTQETASLYPTFKEWKLQRMPRDPQRLTRLYPTFKEWKLPVSDIPYVEDPDVYILPLRNENSNEEWQNMLHSCLYPTFKEWKL